MGLDEGFVGVLRVDVILLAFKAVATLARVLCRIKLVSGIHVVVCFGVILGCVTSRGLVRYLYSADSTFR